MTLPLHNRRRVARPRPGRDRRGPSRGPRARPRAPRPRDGAPPARPRARRADEDRERLGRDPLRRASRANARQPGRRPGREPRLRQLGGADEPVAGRRRGRGGPHARGPATPTSPGLLKFGHSDVRNVLERASARETAARVAAGALAKELLRAFGVSVHSHVVQIGSVRGPGARRPRAPRTSPAWTTRRSAASTRRRARRWWPRSTACGRRTRASAGSSRCGPSALVPGLGSHTSWEERLDARLAQALVSIQAVKGVSVGEAWEVAGRPGSESHDEIFWSEERGWHRETNRAGGVEGGMSNGEPLFVRAALKPISTLTKPLRSVDTETKEPAEALRERTDSTVVPAAARGGRGDDRPGAGALLPGEVRRRPHRRRARRPGRLPGADRVAALEGHDAGRSAPAARRPAIVFIGFMGAGKTAAANAARAAGLEAIEADELLEGELGMPIAGFFGQSRRGGVPEPRVRRGGAAARGRRRRRDRARRRGGVLGAGPRSARPPRRRLAPGLRRGGVAAGRGQRPAAGPGPGQLRGAARRARADLRGARRRDPAPRRRGDGRAGAARAARAARAAARDADGLGGQRVGRVPGLRRRGPARRRAGGRSQGRRFCVTDTTVAGLYGECGRAARGAGRGRARASAPRRSPRPSACCASWRSSGCRAPTTWWRSAAAWSATSPASARRPTSAESRWCRCRPRCVAQVDSAYGGKTGVDLPEAKNYVGAYHLPSAVIADTATLATLPAEELAAGFVEVVKTALIAGGWLWERGAGARRTRSGGARRRRSSPARAPSSRSSPPTSATAAAGRCSTWATPSVTRSRRRAATSATATARRWGSGCWRRFGSRARTSSATRSRDLLDRHGLPTRLDPAIDVEAVLAAVGARQEAHRRRASASCSWSEPGEPAIGQRVDPDSVRAAVEELR